MTTYAVIDVANLFHRCQFVTRGDAFQKAGAACHIVFMALAKLRRDIGFDHIVFCVEGRSWRYDVYPHYKRKRKLNRLEKNDREKEEDEVFFSVMSDFVEFVQTKTRCTVLQAHGVEGDDFVARWIQLHPNDHHILLSGDSDFIQLLAPNVTIVDGVQERIINCDRVTNFKGDDLVFSVDASKGKLKVGDTLTEARKKHDKNEREREKAFRAGATGKKKISKAAANKALVKTGIDLALLEEMNAPAFVKEEFSFEVEPNWWQLALFIKIIRGDDGDDIKAAYPGVRYNGTKAKIGIREAWDDRTTGGYAWNNFMLQRWDKLVGVDKDGNSMMESVRVMDEFATNEMLIDLTKQPEHIKDLMDQTIVEAVQKQPVGNVGFAFLKFCGEQNLPALARDAAAHAAYLNAPYVI